MQDTNNTPGSWLGHRLINKAAAEEMGASVLPSDKALAGRVWLALSDADGDPLFVAGIVVGVKFTAAAVLYSLAFPVAPQPREGETMYAVVDDIASGLVLAELPDGETVFDAVMTEDAATLIPREPLVSTPAPVLDSVGLLGGAHLEGELTERCEALRSALATDAEPAYTLGVIREVVSLTHQVRGGTVAPVAELDPTEWPGYAEVLRDEALAVKWQDRLDSFFQGRLIDVRNALRGLGWTGEGRNALEKNGIIARFDFWQVGAGKNVVGMTVNGIRDDLTKNTDELAAAIDATAALPTAATLTGAELGQFADTDEGRREMREAAKKFFQGNLLETKVFNASINADIAFNTSGMKKMLSFSRDPRKLKLVPALPKILANGLRTRNLPLRGDESNVVAVHVLKADVSLEDATVTVRVIVKERDDGSFFYDHSVNREDLGRSTEILDSVDSTELSLTARHPAEPSAGQVLMDSVGDSGEVFNLFIEGEALEALADEPAAHSEQFATYRDWIAKELAAGNTIPAGTMEVIRMDTRLEDGEAEQLAALAAATPAPQEKRSMEQIIKIAADTLAQLRRIDVYRVLDAAGDQRAELATFIATGRADLVREVTDVMAEEWPDLGWTFAPAAVVEHTDGSSGALLVPNKDGTPKELTVPPVPVVEEKSEQERNPARSGDMAFLNSVIGQSVDMWADDLADKIEAMMTTYESDGEMMELASRAIDSYTDFMLAAA
jgi:hypothetical protein